MQCRLVGTWTHWEILWSWEATGNLFTTFVSPSMMLLWLSLMLLGISDPVVDFDLYIFCNCLPICLFILGTILMEDVIAEQRSIYPILSSKHLYMRLLHLSVTQLSFQLYCYFQESPFVACKKSWYGIHVAICRLWVFRCLTLRMFLWFLLPIGANYQSVMGQLQWAR